MSEGLRYDSVMEMPPGMRQQVVTQILARVSAPEWKEDPTHKEDPCETCLRWDECCGVDENCPRR